MNGRYVADAGLPRQSSIPVTIWLPHLAQTPSTYTRLPSWYSTGLSRPISGSSQLLHHVSLQINS